MLAARAPTKYITDSALSPRTDDQTLRFTKNGTFQISVFEDLHFAEGNSPLNADEAARTILTGLVRCCTRFNDKRCDEICHDEGRCAIVCA